MASDDSDSDQSHFKFYHYDPSLAAACVFIVLFTITSIGHLVLIVKHRTWYFIPLLIGGVFEVTGYVARAISHGQAPNPTLAPYVIQTLLILVAPALLAASIYMILGRIIISMDGESYSLIKRKWLTKTFVTTDVCSFFVQLGGGGLMASSKSSTAALGSHIVLAGLIIQIVIFGFFIAIAAVFHVRLRANPTIQSLASLAPWERFMKVLYVTSAFIMFRSIVRVAEFIEGFEGNIIRHEVYLYCFDAIPMAAVMVIFNFWYPSNFSKWCGTVGVDVESADSNIELSKVRTHRKSASFHRTENLAA